MTERKSSALRDFHLHIPSLKTNQQPFILAAKEYILAGIMSPDDKSQILPYARRPDFKVARATELSGADRRLFRFLEIVPGVAAWATIIGIVLASIYVPFSGLLYYCLFYLLGTQNFFLVGTCETQLEASQAPYGA